MDKELGQHLNLSVLLSDFPAIGLFRVLYTLTRPDGSTQSTGELTDFGNGVFAEMSEVMPNYETINAIFRVFEPDGVTPSTAYDGSKDVYQLVTASGSTVKTTVITTEVAAKIDDSSQLTANLETFSIDTELETNIELNMEIQEDE